MTVTLNIRHKAAPREHLLFSEHMTAAPYDGPLRETFLGQAHIAGTGPEGTTCRECVFWHKKAWRKVPGGGYEEYVKPPEYFGETTRDGTKRAQEALLHTAHSEQGEAAYPSRRQVVQTFRACEQSSTREEARMSTIAQQASAVEAAARVVSGAAQKPSASEKAYLVERLKEAAVTLRNVECREGRA